MTLPIDGSQDAEIHIQGISTYKTPGWVLFTFFFPANLPYKAQTATLVENDPPKR